MITHMQNQIVSLSAAYPYRCYAILKPNGRYTGWRFDLARREELYRKAARKVNGTALASAQRFAAVRGRTGEQAWKTRAGKSGAEECFRGENALPVWSPLYFDIDCAEDIGKALVFARATVAWFRETLALPEEDVRIWFSGSKGFHLFVNPLALGIEPEIDLTRRIIRPVVIRLQRELVSGGAPDLEPDLSAYSLPRLLRLPNELNPKSNLYKIELQHDELESLSIDAIRDIAREPRELDQLPGSTEPQEKASVWWQGQCTRIKEETEFRRRAVAFDNVDEQSRHYSTTPFSVCAMPDCIRKLLEVRAPPGVRNRIELQLACWARSTGRSERQAGKLLARWSIRNRPEKTTSHAARESASVVRAVWSHGYGFSCSAVRRVLSAIDHVAHCDSCALSGRKRRSTLAALRIGSIKSPHSINPLSLEDGYASLYELAKTACRN